ncbi:hypothetical protein TNCV_995911 [Trichonephila clavipes]|nr:hypothetical protein TNCV_995911 [Trichonephila clavipes]
MRAKYGALQLKSTSASFKYYKNKALRTILDVPVYVPRRYLHKELKILPINSRIKQLSTKFHNQITSHNNPTIQAQSNITSRLRNTHKYPIKTTQLRTKF